MATRYEITRECADEFAQYMTERGLGMIITPKQKPIVTEATPSSVRVEQLIPVTEKDLWHLANFYTPAPRVSSMGGGTGTRYSPVTFTPKTN